MTTLHHQGVEENIFKRKVRDEEEYVSKTRKADELHEVRLTTETKLGELRVKEVDILVHVRIQHLLQKRKLEIEILNLDKLIKLKALGLNERE